MYEVVSWDRLDVAGFRVSMKRNVRRLARSLPIIGAFVVFAGIQSPMIPAILVGSVLIAVGVWNLVRTSIHGLLIDGVAVILTGVFSFFAWRWIGPSGTASTHLVKALFTGVVQIAWGIRRVMQWANARNTVNDPVAIARLEEIVRALEKRRVRDDEAVVEFRNGRWNQTRNRLGLYAEGAVGLLEGGAVRLDKKSDVWIEAVGTGIRGRTIKVSVRMSDLERTGSMSAKHFERFERWKLGMAPAQSVAA